MKLTGRPKAFPRGRSLVMEWIKEVLGIELELYYVNGPQTLHPPLSAEEEAALISVMAEDRKAKQTLIERNLRLVVYIARKFESPSLGIEDLVSIGTIGLIKAINTFKSDKMIKLATYASRCIENEILMFIRKQNGTKNYGIGRGGQEMTQKEVADMLGISQSYISRLEKKIIARMKEYLIKQNY